MGGAGGLGDGLPTVSRVSLWGVVFKIGKLKTASSDDSGGRVVGLLCVDSNLALDSDFFSS